MCRVLEVSSNRRDRRCGYYTWRRRPESKRVRQNRKLLEAIRTIHAESKSRYGSPRIHVELREKGVACGKNRVARLMRLHGIKALQTKPFKVTTDSKHNLPVAQNVLDRQFDVEVANARWAADITYIWTSQGWLYLAVVMDLFSRRIVGWAMQKSLARQLVLNALMMALKQRRPGAGLLHHSDRGSQYASGDYQELLGSAGCRCSMSRRGNCWDNAPVESFFATLKRELVHHHRFRSRAEARAALFEYIEVWYNRKRRHSSLGYLSPANYEEMMAAKTVAIAA